MCDPIDAYAWEERRQRDRAIFAGYCAGTVGSTRRQNARSSGECACRVCRGLRWIKRLCFPVAWRGWTRCG